DQNADGFGVLVSKLKGDPTAREALQFILAQSYLSMGQQIGASDSSKVMFMDPRSIPATLEGMQQIVGDLGRNGTAR
ncbi:MAG: paraslipin, partial [Cyanobacteria bacterium J06628_6]